MTIRTPCCTHDADVIATLSTDTLTIPQRYRPRGLWGPRVHDIDVRVSSVPSLFGGNGCAFRGCALAVTWPAACITLGMRTKAKRAWLVLVSDGAFPHETNRAPIDPNGPHYSPGARWYTPGWGERAGAARARLERVVAHWAARGYTLRIEVEVR